MRIITISKGNGKKRIIYAPNADERYLLEAHMPYLEDAQESTCGPEVHGFRPHRSPITNAAAHLNREFTLSFDLAGFFDSVDARHLRKLLPEHMLREVREGGVLHLGAPRQGLPTSPFVANIAASPMDADIRNELCLPVRDVVYTRYADDLSFSWSGDRHLHNWLRREVKRIVEQHRFTLAKGKTHLQSSAAGRRVICGVAVDHGLHARREARRKLRAAEHNVNTITRIRELACAFEGTPEPDKHIKLAHRQLSGLRAWCSMTPPRKETP